MRRLMLVLIMLAAGPWVTHAQFSDPPKYELRGAWIATVINLDWPARGASTEVQKYYLRLKLERLQDAGINLVFFQVRSEADAMYASSLEPWSYWLTGQQGRAPDPAYDPLAYAIEVAHELGMELHAWFNPYRANRGSGYSIHSSHVTQIHPEWTYQAGPYTLLDPGQAAVRDYIVSVIMDVARRYDVDGVHFDDYFYPYPPNQIGSQDALTFQHESRGFTSLHNWRRDNVNLLVAQVADSLRAYRPAIKFGISPFGIWKNGVPNGITGLDAYSTIFADATAWLQAGTVDYLVPQLYWRFGGNQDFAKLAPWWASQLPGNVHLYIGHGLYRADHNTFSNTLFSATEVPDQVEYARDYLDISGSVFFRSSNITVFSSKDFVNVMRNGLYRYPALTPPMHWKSQEAPQPPTGLVHDWIGDDEVRLSWDAPANAPARYAVYRVLGTGTPDLTQAATDARNLIAVTGSTYTTDQPGTASDDYHYFVQSVSHNSVESGPSNVVSLQGRATARESDPPAGLAGLSVYPSPLVDFTRIEFTLEHVEPVTVRISDVLGREVRTILGGDYRYAGTHAVIWDGKTQHGRRLPPGTYWVVVDLGARRLSQAIVLTR